MSRLQLLLLLCALTAFSFFGAHDSLVMAGAAATLSFESAPALSKKLQMGKSSQQEIRSAFGEPKTVEKNVSFAGNEGCEVWTYDVMVGNPMGKTPEEKAPAARILSVVFAKVHLLNSYRLCVRNIRQFVT